MGILEWVKFIADVLLFLGDVIGLTISVIWAILEFMLSFLNFLSSIISTFSGYTNLVPFMAFGLSMFALYVVKAIFAR